MAAPNTKPIMPVLPNNGSVAVGGSFVKLTAANPAMDGTGTVPTVFTAGNNGGARIDRLICVPLGTNDPSVLRVFVNNGNLNSTATNNICVDDVKLPATIANSAGPNGPRVIVPIEFSIPPGHKLNVCLGAAVSAGWNVYPVGGDY